MNKVIHRAGERGVGNYGWLTTRYSFSFADWYEPSRMGFGALRVINDDQIAPHSGFPTHAHKDMEIITFIREGTLTHKDSLGNVGVIKEGEVQAMSAGTGVAHSEYNEGDTPVSLFQIWIQPNAIGRAPRYSQQSFASSKKPGITCLVGPDGTPDALPISQDAYISRAVLDQDHPLSYTLRIKTNGVYLFVVEGEVEIADEILNERDAIGITGTETLQIATPKFAELLIFEVPI
jgi:quercetin 2,3-dioxygenase